MLSTSEHMDFIVYAGTINMDGYHAICEALKGKKAGKAMLVLATPGGDAHAGFRIARALQHAYGSFDALVPRYCKSAGTLILLGARHLYLDDMSELGPLDVQVKKGDELVGRNSGLDIFQAVNYLQNQSMTAFRSYLIELTRDHGLSTRVASEIATTLTSRLFEPIAAQIDPIKLAEMQRATEIAFEYGNRLNDKGRNIRANGISKLVGGYPSHGFVIDRKEARSIFIEVKRPEGVLAEVSQALHAKMEESIDRSSPVVSLITLQDPTEVQHDNAPNAEGGQGRAPSAELAVGGDIAGTSGGEGTPPTAVPANDSAIGASAPDDEPPTSAAA